MEAYICGWDHTDKPLSICVKFVLERDFGVVELDVAVKVGKPVVESGVTGMGRSVLAGVVKNYSKMGIYLNIFVQDRWRQVRGI